MGRFSTAIRKDRLYILLLIFILLINVLAILPSAQKSKKKAGPGAVTLTKEDRAYAAKAEEDIFLERENVEKVFNERRDIALLFGLTSLLFFALLSLGLIIDILFVFLKAAGKGPDISTYKLNTVSWNIWDVCKAVILFLFFGYLLIILEAVIAKTFPALKNENFRMIINSSVMDILSVLFILHFTKTQYGEKLIALGISMRNFFKNIFYGITAYAAIMPVLVAILVIVSYVIQLIKYAPPKQPVVELFFKEKNTQFLVYTGIFAAVIGPMIEELFFRGFMYSALKKNIGIWGSAIVTAGIFAALHTHAVGFFPIMALGILLAYLYEKTGTLVAPITVHVAHNLSMVFLVFLLKQLRG